MRCERCGIPIAPGCRACVTCLQVIAGQITAHEVAVVNRGRRRHGLPRIPVDPEAGAP